MAKYLRTLLACLVFTSSGCAVNSERSASGNTAVDRLLVKTGYISVEVNDVAAIETKVGAIVKDKAGYVVSSRMTNSVRYYAELKIPAKELENVMTEIARLGNERSRNIEVMDVTESVVDKEAELANLTMLRDRMRDLLLKATKVEEILRVEEELNRIQTRIDSTTGKLKSMKGQIEYSHLRVDISQKPVYGPLGYIGVGVWWVIEKLFIIK